jgi:hypothetical protein
MSGWKLVLVLASVAVAVFAAVALRPWGIEGDVQRFVQIANGPGRPYGDIATEFGPLQTLLIRTFLDTDVAAAGVRVNVLSIACFIGIVSLLRRAWGWNTAATYAGITLPLQMFMPFRIDYLPTLLAVAAAVVARRSGGTSAVFLATGAGFKVWPGLLAPLFLRRSFRAWRTFVVSILVLLAMWFAVGGFAGMRQVSTFRDADGWQVESTVGIVTWLVTPDDHRVEAGAVRVGSVADWHRVVLAVALGYAIIVISKRSWSTSLDPAGVPSVVTVATLLVLAPVASPQYLAWLTPWVAIASPSFASSSIRWLCVIAGVAASLSFPIYWDIYGGVAHLQFLAAVRALCTVFIAILAWQRLLAEPATRVEASSHPAA